MTIASNDSRPLLPTDEHQINSQLAKSHGVVQRGSGNFAVRSSSNRNIAELNVRKPAPLQKALTDTDNFIQMHAKRSQQTVIESSEDESRTGDVAGESSAYDDQYSLDSENASSSSGNDRVLSSESDKDYLNLGHRMDLDPRLKKQREEWADRGAAKIVREVTNPETGRTMRQVVKKGIKDFAFGDTLGDGSYSTVLLATSKESGKKYAVKVLSKEYLIRQKKVKYVNIEKSALQRLNNSRGIIKLYFTFQDESSLYFLLEYAPNGDFLSVMKKYGSLSEDCACYYAAQIINSINFIHSKGIIHRDIKPENILLDKDMKVKLTDFGTAKILEPRTDSTETGSTESFDLLSRSKSFVGTAEYVSPELLNDNYVDYRCDIWAFGCILFQMIAGKPPFKATNEYLTFQKVMKVQYAFTAGFPLVVRDLVKGILVKRPDQRMTIPQIEKHHFFKDTNFKDGSVWDSPAPEIQPYKVSAKSMQPIPALSSGVTPRRTVITRPYAKSTSNLPSNSTSNGLSKLSKLPPSSPAVSSTKKALDERTAQILQNAKRAVGDRKSSNQGGRRATSGAALAASAALTRKASDPPSPQFASTSHKIKPSATYRSSGSISTSQISSDVFHRSTPNSSGATSSLGKTSNSSKLGLTEKAATHTMNKTDISWSYFLKNIDERVLGVGEVNLAVVPTDILEKRVSKVHGSIEDPDYALSLRKTRLSQVVRAGGDVTGFRTDPNQNIPPDTVFYEELGFDHDDISKDYRKPGGELPPSPTDEKKSAGSSAESNSSEELGNLAITGKFKKLFHHANSRPENGYEPIETSDYFKRMLLVTNQGRCLVLVKKAKAVLGAASNYQQIYDIDLCQPGTKLKEIILPIVDSTWRTFLVQTPYNSFVCKSSRESSGNWLRTITRAIKSGHDFVTARNRKDEQLRSEAFAAARLASPILNNGSNLFEKGEPHSRSDPSSPVKISGATSPALASSDSKYGNSGSGSGATKAGRFFDNFISSKEKIPKKHASPVPLPTKLVNGLPAHSSPNVLGLGVSDSRRESTSSPTASNEPRKIVTSANSRLLARSEHTLRYSK